MHPSTSRSTFGILFAVFSSLVAGFSPVRALLCTGGQPVCFAQPGDRTCSLEPTRQCHTNADCSAGTCDPNVLGIGGTVTANPFSISSVVLTGATNVTLTASAPGSLVTFRVVQTNPALDGTATVVATDSNFQTCRVPVNFHVRSSGAAVNEPVCPLAESYGADVISSPVSPAGTTACSSHLATCADVLPFGYEFSPWDSRILSIRSPIAGAGVITEVTRAGTFIGNLRLMFSRSTDLGASYTPFADVTTSVLPGSTKIRGTTQWSDVRFAVAFAPAGAAAAATPTMGEWAMILLILLMLTASSALLTRRRFALAASAASEPVGPALFVPRIYIRTLAGTVALASAALAACSWLDLAPSSTDVAGALTSAAILAYLAQLWIVQSWDPPRR